MCANNQIVQDIFSLITIVIALVGTLTACFTYRNKVKNDRTKFLTQLLEKLTSHQEAIRMIEYGKWYEREKFHNSPDESKLDLYLTFLEYVLYLSEYNYISKKEFKMFDYYFDSMKESEDLSNYFDLLEEYVKIRGTNYFPFFRLRNIKKT